MARQLPPLNALRVFEAAARHLSFTRAAEELHVTQTAVSHQVKLLEDTLGQPLFRRFNRRLVLTEAGQAYLPPLRDAFDAMDAATKQIGRRGGPRQLRITTLQSLAAKWLVPRMPRFQARHPGLDLLLSTGEHAVDFRREDIDLGIRLGAGNYPGLHVEYLMDDFVFPVCAPGLVDGDPPLRRVEDLKHHALLHDMWVLPEEHAPVWRNWLAHAAQQGADIRGIDATRGAGFSDSAMAIQAAIAGQGVVLGRRALVADDLAAGLLVRPFGPELQNRFSYYLVCPPAVAQSRDFIAFRDWLVEEIRLGDL